MNILFLTDQFYPKPGGTANILEIFTNDLVKQGYNIIVINVNLSEDKKGKQVYLHNKIKVFNININIENKSNKKKILDSFYDREFVKLFKIMNKFIINKVISLVNEAYTTDYRKSSDEIINIVKNENIDLVISVSNPFYMNFLGYLIKKDTKIKWLIYMLDPYFNHYTSLNLINRKIKNENKMLKTADLSIVTDLIYESYKKSILVKYMYKVKKLNFPNIKENKFKETLDDLMFDKNYINCVFIGYLYPDIRSPKFIFDIIKNLKYSKIRLYIIGGIYGEFEEGFLEYYKNVLGDRLIFVDKVESRIAFNAILNSDILINIGNTIHNQMPSKIFDYISSGKPIINLYKINNCPTLKYTQKYPLCLDILEESRPSNSVLEKFEKFCIVNKNRKIDFSEIEKIYFDCTSDVVSKDFVNIIKEVMGGKV